MLATALARRGYAVLVLTRSPPPAHEDGVDYVHCEEAFGGKLTCRSLVVSRYSAVPPIGHERLIVRASDMPGTAYDQWTAVYDISAHTVYLPDGTPLEAHSGLGDKIDDPRYVNERDRGATPPGVYHLTLRESLFHGVQALRLNPIGGGFTFNRVGLLAHPYMLGPNGDSNGCVSFKTYDAFLRAFQSGEVKRLAVVAEWTGRPHQFGLFASLR